MKNRILKYMFVTGIIATIISCYDHGDGDFKESGTLTIAGINDSYAGKSLIDSLRINPVIENMQEGDYEYLWYANSIGTTPKEEPDTICREKNLNDLIKLPVGNYSLIFRATHVKTKVVSYKKTSLSVGSNYTTGWILLKEMAGSTDIDMFTPSGIIMPDIMKNNHGETMKGKPVSMGYDHLMLSARNTKCLVLLSEQDAKVLIAENMTLNSDFDRMFFDTPKIRKPQRFRGGSAGDLGFVNDNKLYLAVSGSPLFQPIAYDDHVISPMICGNMYYIYYHDATEGAIYQAIYGNATLVKSNLKHDLIHTWAQANDYFAYQFLFRDRVNKDVMYYVSNTMQYTLPSDLKLAQAELLTHNQGSNDIYFSLGDKLYMYYTGNQAEEEIYDFKGEEITHIGHISRYAPSGLGNLVVATYSDGKYKFYQFELTAGKPKTDIPPVIMQGEGRIKHSFYMNPSFSNYTFPDVY